MSKYKKGLLCLSSMLTLSLTMACSSVQLPSIEESTQENSQAALPDSAHLPLLLSDAKISQESRLSQMKADLIKSNNGYLASDKVTAIIELPEPSLMDHYLAKSNNQYVSLSNYATSTEGIAYTNQLQIKQEQYIQNLINKGYIDGVEHRYTTLMNGFSVTTTYGDFQKMEGLSSISQTYLCETYNLPKTTSSNGYDAVSNIVDIYPTGIFNSSSVEFNGEGTAVAVLDSGFDITHSVFNNEPTKAVIDEESLESVIGQLEASKTSSGLLVSDVYKTKKIPYAYDYADKDAEVDPSTSSHGTHVAGIIGGQDEVVTGVATHTQLVLLKVFSDEKEGAETEDILAALEDAVILGVDAINMSLGTSCGFSRAADEEGISQVYDKINECGISLITAASNDYSSAYGGDNGNTNKVTNPDSATVGAPSTYNAALSVASISGTLSNYFVGPDSRVFFFKESNSINGKQNDFIKELGVTGTDDVVIDYVTVPGSGLKVNYSSINVKGKIALVRRGNNTFEEKAAIAKEQGAIGCIIYNNVAGDILMSMGKSDHIPTCSLSKDDGETLAKNKTGQLTFNGNYKAGPFISDFSSWGPTSDLKLKPEITAHGGNITSSVPGGGYDQQSGTSMASPNMCGVVVLIRQYLKEKYKDENYTAKQISDLAYQLLMSTATIANNEEGNPYFPRKQGAGLASLKDATTTPAYLNVDGNPKPKLELGDDPNRTGLYEMKFNVVNISNTALQYNVDLLAMTESVSSSDKDYVAEKSYMLGGSKTVTANGGTVSGTTVSVPAQSTVQVTVKYRLSDEDKKYINESFQYGMFVEGFVVLTPTNSATNIDLNIPFLAFYGDWTEAPLFDKTYYEVESEAHDGSIDEEDKIKADYYATTPFASYLYNYVIPLGSYIYDIDTSKYEPIAATEEHIAISNALGTMDGIGAIYGGLLRNAKTMTYTITDELTGEVIYHMVDENAIKAHFGGGGALPYYNYLKLKSSDLNLVNNRSYHFKMEAALDYGDGGEAANVRNSFEFSFFMDEEAPLILDATYDKTYDKTLKKDRYYVTLTVYDNHYVQSISPILFTDSSNYSLLDTPIPVYGEKNSETKVRFEITDYMDSLYSSSLSGYQTSYALSFYIDDYALNTNVYMCQLPGTRGEFKFTEDGTLDGEAKNLLMAEKGEVIDLVPYLATADKTLDADKDYLKYLEWKSSKESVAVVKEGQVYATGVGRCTITVSERLNQGYIATMTVNVTDSASTISLASIFSSDATLKDIQFTYFDTVYAHPDCGTVPDIGSIGDKKFISNLPQDSNGSAIIEMYPGESIHLNHRITPWYLPEDRYELKYSSTNNNVATVDENGVVKTLKKGSCTIKLNIIVDGKQSNMMATIKINVLSEFVIENNTLVAYKGIGGDIVIPDDEGILYIGSYAFCLYELDKEVELPEDDFDLNKIPGTNDTVTSVIIPDGVEDVKKYAFYNCTNLTTVTLPNTIKYVREYSFYNDAKLENINLENVQVIGASAFYHCVSLKELDLNKAYSIAGSAFEGCTGLTTIDITALRNSGKEVFKDCTNLKTIKTERDTKLSVGMFKNTAIEALDLDVKRIPEDCFRDCASLKTVVINEPLIDIGQNAFANCVGLTSVKINSSVRYIYEQAFSECHQLASILLPNSSFMLKDNAFEGCSALKTLEFNELTQFTELGSNLLGQTIVSEFVTNNNVNYASSNGVLTSKDGSVIVLVGPNAITGEYTVPQEVKLIKEGAFSGLSNLTNLTITNPDLILEGHVFADCVNLKEVVLPDTAGFEVAAETFKGDSALTSVQNLSLVSMIGAYAFYQTGLTVVELQAQQVKEYAFAETKLETVTLGNDITLETGAFAECFFLTTVNMPEAGGVSIGNQAFYQNKKLATIDCSKAVGTIGASAFQGCVELTNAQLTNITTIGENAFADCAKLAVVEMPIVKEIQSGAFKKSADGLKAPIISSITLPDSLTTLGQAVFYGNLNLKSIVIPANVSVISALAFAGCQSLTNVELKGTNILIEQEAFSDCVALKTINLEEATSLGKYAFLNCSALESIDLAKCTRIGEGCFTNAGVETIINPDFVEVIDAYAFQSTSLKNAYFPSLRVMKDGVFSNCTSLTEFTFSDDLEELGKVVFYKSNNLTHLYAMQDAQKVSSKKINDYATLQDDVLYTYTKAGYLCLAVVPAAKNIETLEVVDTTSIIEPYSGNENKLIQTIILPDSLETIGNFAFYGYTSLNTVEFRSYQAPTLESFQAGAATLTPNDPGYELLHPFFDVFGYEFSYFHFIDQVGKKKPIKMILPANETLIGYENVLYEAYFGKVESATRSDYLAKDSNTVLFLELISKIPTADKVTLADDDLIMSTVTAKNSLTQDLTKFGYSKEEVDTMYTLLEEARLKLNSLKLAQSSASLQQLQKDIDALSPTFKIENLDLLQNITKRINALSRADKNILDLRKYDAVVDSYNSYLKVLNEDASMVGKVADNSYAYQLLVALSSALSLAALVYLGKNKWL